jgi:hypothetical protein
MSFDWFFNYIDSIDLGMRNMEEVKVCHFFLTGQIKYAINFKSNSHIY